MVYPPLAGNPLRSRADLQRAMRDLFAPLVPCFSPGAARVRIGSTGAHYSEVAAELEGFSRPLWGLAPLAAGGGSFDHWELFRRGLASGTDPAGEEYWGRPQTADQRHVEMAAIAWGLCLAPEALWEPLSHDARRHLAAWLGNINDVSIHVCNWLGFRVLVNLALFRVGEPFDPTALQRALDDLEKQYLGHGWYSDGLGGQRDYYVPFAMQYYLLLYAHLAGDIDPVRVQRIRERAALFAQDFIYWQAADGPSVPFGRSLTYRFGQAAFWSALAYTGIEVFSPGIIKGIVLRHLRWWFAQPIFTDAGRLTIGYCYPNLNLAENYNAPGSPYWALKTFLVLALPESDPFWASAEEPLPELETVHTQNEARMVVCRDPSSRHVVALCNRGPVPLGWRHSAEKYGKFAYSTHFGFSVPTEPVNLSCRGADNMLALSEEGTYWRTRRENRDSGIDDGILRSAWAPWPDVEITTWLVPAWPWHVRLHRLRTARPLLTAEGGFAIRYSAAARLSLGADWRAGVGFACVPESDGFSGVRDLLAGRTGENILSDPNSNLLIPNTVVPTLRADLPAGEHWLAAAVLGHRGLEGDALFLTPPWLEQRPEGFVVMCDGQQWALDGSQAL